MDGHLANTKRWFHINTDINSVRLRLSFVSWLQMLLTPPFRQSRILFLDKLEVLPQSSPYRNTAIFPFRASQIWIKITTISKSTNYCVFLWLLRLCAFNFDSVSPSRGFRHGLLLCLNQGLAKPYPLPSLWQPKIINAHVFRVLLHHQRLTTLESFRHPHRSFKNARFTSTGFHLKSIST